MSVLNQTLMAVLNEMPIALPGSYQICLEAFKDRLADDNAGVDVAKVARADAVAVGVGRSTDVEVVVH